MDSLCKKLMLGGSMAAMAAAITASASAQEQQAQNVENVTVSASRISIQGYEAPTPVTVIGAETLQRDAKVDIGDAIRELPAVGQSDSQTNGSHAGNASQGDAGIDTINLRSLGVVRTLVLFDGQRVVTSNPNAGGPPAIGGVDLSTIPTSVIQRVDVVTGGASASWGSDAVAGVVNLVIDKTYTGFKANATFGNDSHGDQKKWKLEAVAGWDFLGGRAHTEFAANYTMSPDAMYNFSRPWYDHINRALYSCAVVNGGPATELCHTPAGVYSNSFTNGGLITASAAGLANTPANLAAIQAIQNIGGQFSAFGTGTPAASNTFRGVQFVGPNAQQEPFNFGIANITPGTNAVGSNCYNCSANPNSLVSNQTPTAVPYHQYNLFNYTSYKITPDITASVMLNYGWDAEENIANDGRQQQVTVKVDNAFIPSALQQQMIAGNVPSFALGTGAIENLSSLNQVSMRNLANSIGQNFVQNYRQLMRGVFTLNGGYKLFGEDWTWNAYAQNSSVRERQWARYNTMNTNFSNAVDAVVVQASGPNSLGGGNAATAAAVRTLLGNAGVPIPAVGSIACRSTLTATSYGVTTSPTSGFQVLQPGGYQPGCVPLDLFGDGTVSQAALNYIAPGRTNDGIADQALYRMGQSVFSISTQGVLPWGLPAGKPAVAFGFEDRLEQQRNQRDPLELGASGVFESGNFSEYAGEYNVQEGFLELDVPVLKNDFVEDLNLNAAGRITSYSTSGLVETWKLGMTSQINEDIKVRTTLSSDIRAPGIGELFSPILVSTQTISYPNGGPNYNIHQLQAGNPLLVPEQAETVEGGIVLTPHWIENLSMSFDWYSITLHGGIFSPSESQIAAQCTAGNKYFCQFIFFGQGPFANGLAASEIDANGNSPRALIGGLTFSADSPGAFNSYYQGPVNANRETTSGLDFQIDYQHELLDGTMSWHILGNYTDEKTRTSLGVTVDGAGAISSDGGLSPLGSVFLTEPKLRMTVSSTYAEGPWSLTAQARIIGSAVLSNYINQSQTVYNSIDDNNVPAVVYGDFRGSYRWNDHIQLYGAIDNAFNGPPPNLPTIGGGGTNCIIYDCIGRSYRVGVRFDD
ncbi:MAG TPA: TonB-dependent receptor [Rhizomicrobium sp.]|jgi:outer membrane receptor protein involved in Fe transport